MFGLGGPGREAQIQQKEQMRLELRRKKHETAMCCIKAMEQICQTNRDVGDKTVGGSCK